MLEAKLGDDLLANNKATCIWKFFQRHFIALKLNAGYRRYLDKIYKILVDMLDPKAGFPLANFFIRSDFFRSKRFYVIKLKLYVKHWKMKNEKFLFDIQTKCSDIANEILNAAIDAERTFKCKWPNITSS